MKEGIGACLIDKPEFIADVVRQNIPMHFTDDVGHRSSDEDFVICQGSSNQSQNIRHEL